MINWLIRLGYNLSQLNRILNTVANTVAAVFIFVLMFMITADVIGRYGFNKPVYGTYEIGQVLLVFIVFLSLAYTQRKNIHIKVEALTRHFSSGVRVAVEISMRLVALFFMGALTWQNINMAWSAWNIGDYTQGMVKVPVYPAWIALALGALLFCFQLLVEITTYIYNRKLS